MYKRFVYFDLGNVLVKFDHAIAVRQLAELAGCSLPKAQYAIFDSGHEIRYENGLLTSPQFVAEINRELQSDLPEDAVIEAVSAIFEPNMAILPALVHIKASGVGVGLLSNTCEGHWEWVTGKRWPTVEGWFDVIVLSYEAQLMKPSEAIYRYCEQKCGFMGQQIFFTDDRADNIAGAQHIGWVTYQYGNPAGLITAFDAWFAKAG